ncbi:MAG TPA: TetR/AcrR family transcriptional regulator [Rhizomicrobium sp.]|jgi:AcrR family transcriptional regulator|nr:TetR/AcrR family transcriptional regulator [Rhizomicrobium sp.]
MRRVLSETDLREFRDRVCTVATELLAERGHDGFNMRELAARLGVSAMTTYRYFNGKNEIFAALRIQAINSLAGRLETFLDLSGLPLERMMAFCRGYVDFALEDSIRYRNMFDHPQPQIVRATDLIGAERRMFRAIAEQVGLFIRCGRCEGGFERLAWNLWASLHGLAALTLVGAIHEPELDGLILDTIGRIAGQGGSPAGSGHNVPGSATEWQPNWTNYANGKPAGWIAVGAAE